MCKYIWYIFYIYKKTAGTKPKSITFYYTFYLSQIDRHTQEFAILLKDTMIILPEGDLIKQAHREKLWEKKKLLNHCS